MKLVTFALTVLLTTAVQANSDSDFDFLLGEHDVTLHAWTGDGWTPPRPQNAEWHGYKGLRDAVIIDEWFDPQAGNGINVRMYDAEEKIWHMMWVSTNGKQVQDLRAQVREGTLTMWQAYPERPNWHAEFSSIDACTWAREDGVTKDGDWQPRFRLVATKRNCQP